MSYQRARQVMSCIKRESEMVREKETDGHRSKERKGAKERNREREVDQHQHQRVHSEQITQAMNYQRELFA